MYCNPTFFRGPNLSFFGLGPWASTVSPNTFLSQIWFFMTPFERYFSRLSENHKVVDIGSTEFKLRPLKEYTNSKSSMPTPMVTPTTHHGLCQLVLHLPLLQLFTLNEICGIIGRGLGILQLGTYLGHLRREDSITIIHNMGIDCSLPISRPPSIIQPG